jgi:predicted Rossmann-fold nucleotide-binding protein
MRTRTVIGLMGGDERLGAAANIGAAIAAEADAALLTGGSIGTASSTRIHQIAMREASRIATARLIGILPGRAPAEVDSTTAIGDVAGPSYYFEAIPGRKKGFYLHTGISSAKRDSITGLTPDVLIFLRGSAGTLTELAYAAAAGRRTYFFQSADYLRSKLHVPETTAKTRKTLASAHMLCGIVNGRPVSVADLESHLATRLATAVDWVGTPKELVRDVITRTRAAGLEEQTGFPAFLGESCKHEFERRVLELE